MGILAWHMWQETCANSSGLVPFHAEALERWMLLAFGHMSIHLEGPPHLIEAYTTCRQYFDIFRNVLAGWNFCTAANFLERWNKSCVPTIALMDTTVKDKPRIRMSNHPRYGLEKLIMWCLWSLGLLEEKPSDSRAAEYLLEVLDIESASVLHT